MIVLIFIVTVWPGLIVPSVNVTLFPLTVLVPWVEDADWTINIFGTGSLTTACVTGVPPPFVAVSVNVIGSPRFALLRSATFVEGSIPGGGGGGGGGGGFWMRGTLGTGRGWV